MSKVQLDTTVEFKGWGVIEKGGKFEQFTYHPRPLGDRDVEIEIECCGVCGSDIHTVDSGWGPADYPVIVGHEIIGKVTKAGPNASKLKVGDRVGVGAQVWACEDKVACDLCKEGDDMHCPRRVFTYDAKYEDGAKAYGGYAEHVRVSEDFAFVIPDNLTSAEAAPLLCAGITVYSPLIEHGVTKGTKVGVVGVGGLGHMALKFANALGAEVTAISSSANKEEITKELGAHHFLNSKKKEDLKSGARSLDVLIVTANYKGMKFEPWLALLKTRGKLIMVGLPEEASTLSLSALVVQRIQLCGSLIGSSEQITQMLEFCGKHKIGATVTTTPMKDVNNTIQDMRDGKARFRYVLEN